MSLERCHLLYANQNFPKRVTVSSARRSIKALDKITNRTGAGAIEAEKERTVIDDVPGLRDQAAGFCGKRMVACPRRAEGVAMQVREAELCLQVVRCKCRQRAAEAMTCTHEQSVPPQDWS